jgi:hypothetical protein
MVLGSISQSSLSFRPFVEHERVYDGSECRNENRRDWQPEGRAQKHGDESQQAIGKNGSGGETALGSGGLPG